SRAGHLDFPGMNQTLTLRPHQKDAVWRGMSSGNTLLAHVVGAGIMPTPGLCRIEVTSRRPWVAKFVARFGIIRKRPLARRVSKLAGAEYGLILRSIRSERGTEALLSTTAFNDGGNRRAIQLRVVTIIDIGLTT